MEPMEGDAVADRVCPQGHVFLFEIQDACLRFAERWDGLDHVRANDCLTSSWSDEEVHGGSSNNTLRRRLLSVNARRSIVRGIADHVLSLWLCQNASKVRLLGDHDIDDTSFAELFALAAFSQISPSALKRLPTVLFLNEPVGVKRRKSGTAISGIVRADFESLRQAFAAFGGEFTEAISFIDRSVWSVIGVEQFLASNPDDAVRQKVRAEVLRAGGKTAIFRGEVPSDVVWRDFLGVGKRFAEAEIEDLVQKLLVAQQRFFSLEKPFSKRAQMEFLGLQSHRRVFEDVRERMLLRLPERQREAATRAGRPRAEKLHPKKAPISF